MKLARETARPAMDPLSTFIAAGAWAAIVGGAALVISLLLDWLVVPYEKLGDAAYLSASYLASAGLRLLSTVLFLWALLALYNRQSIATGTLGLWGFVVAFFGTALFAGSVWERLPPIAPSVKTFCTSPRGTPAAIFQLARGYGNGSSPFDLAGISVPAGGRTRCPVGGG